MIKQQQKLLIIRTLMQVLQNMTTYLLYIDEESW